MTEEQSANPVRGTSPRLIIAAVIILVIAIILLGFAFANQTADAGGLLPALASPTPGDDNPDAVAIEVSFSELNADPLAFVDRRIQVTGGFLPLEPPECQRFSGPDLRWALVSESLQLETSGYERIVRILQPGTEMTVQGLWRLYQGPLGCGKGPAVGSAWYLQVQKIIHPNPLVGNSSGIPIQIEGSDSSFPELLPTRTPEPTATATATPQPPTLTATATLEQFVPTVTVVVTGTIVSTPSITPLATATNGLASATPGSGTSAPTATANLTATAGPGGGTTQPTATTAPALPTATDTSGGYPGDATPTATISPYP